MKKNILAVLTVLTLLSILTVTQFSPVKATPASAMYEYYNTDDNAYEPIYGSASWVAQAFTHSVAFNITSVKLKLYRIETPGTVIISIRATTGGETAKPTGSDLISTTIQGNDLTTDTAGFWYEITFPSPYLLLAQVTYAIVIGVPDGTAWNHNVTNARSDDTASTYPRGRFCWSTDGGVSWESYGSVDLMFEVWGETFSYESPPITEEITWYMRSDTHTVNTVEGYVLNENPTTESTYKQISDDGNLTVYYGWRVWLVHSSGSETELTSDYVYSWRIVEGEGIQNIVWNCPGTSLSLSDAIKLVLYIRVNGAWQAQPPFISDRLEKKSIVASEWAFETYTKRTYSDGKTYGSVYWGGSTYKTAVAGIEFEEPDVYETINYKLHSGDIIGAIIHPYIAKIGSLFYLLVLLYICVPLYNRYKSFAPILIFLIVCGGATGLGILLIPNPAMQLVWLLAMFALAGILYKVFR